MGTATVGNAAQRQGKAKSHDTARSPRERYPADRSERLHGAAGAMHMQARIGMKLMRIIEGDRDRRAETEDHG